MSIPARLLAFGAALVAVFVLALVGARILLPADLAQARADHPTAEEAGMDHTGASSPHEEASPHDTGSHAGAGSATDPVRGLAVAQDGYQLTALTAPAGVDEPGRLAFRLTGPDGRAVTNYTTAHDKDLHLIVVRSDGTRFRHVHPTLAADGTWSIPWRWLAAGSYRVFADFVPAATGETLTLTSTVDVAGTVDPVPLADDTTTDNVAGYTVTLDGTLQSGAESTLTFTVARDGRSVTTEPYLGAAGHLVALRVGDLAYLHVHPMDEPAQGSSPAVAFMAEAPTPGRYLLYLDFQVDGQVHTATFTTTTATR